ncbi:InlB B-repeat-containing protein [Salinibacterium hongtaonis]|nr:InlB B-repeat-containing protein [Salinibacterium hongtaonis]
MAAPARRIHVRRASAIFLAATLSALLALGGVVAGPAQPAAAANPTTFADLQTAFTAGGAVTLGGDITQSGGGLVVPSGTSVTLNLGGRTLNVTGVLGQNGNSNGSAGIAVEGGASLTVVGPGTLYAKGGAGSAGIGGRVGAAIGSITINSGTVTATGGEYGAGIGTGDAGQAPAGTRITIAGGTVTAATTSVGAAAIGGGENGAMPDITISGGTVNTEIFSGVGIGAGYRGAADRTITISGGTVNTYGSACFAAIGTSIYNWNNPDCVPDSKFVNIIIGAGATVNVSVGYPAAHWNPTIGFANSAGTGTFTNSGTLIVGSHVLRIPGNATATNTGTIRGAVDGSLAGNDFVLTFDAWGGHSAPSPLRVTAPTLNAAQVAVPSAPIREGYTFEGWWSSRTAGSKLTTTTALSTSTWYARWSGPGHPITFDPAGGVEIPSISVESGQTFTPPTTTRANYTFAGWFTAVSGGTEWTAATPVTGPTTLYAHWALTTYTVSFDTGTGGSAVPSQTVTHGATAAVPVDLPTRLGHTFGGWFTTSGGASVWNASTPVTSDTTVFALWTADTYTVSFDTGPGASTVSSKTVAHGSTVSLPAAPARSGYRFWGWVTTSGGTTEWSRTAPVTGPMTLYARWVINTYTVSFDSNDGIAVASQTVAHGDSAAVPTPPTRTGYSFAGWMTSAAGSTAWDATAAVTSDVTVYARWTVNSYTVTFDTGAGGSFEPSQTIVYGGRASVPSDAPIRSHHSFVGWFTAASGGSAWDDSAVVTGNVTVYARWLIDSYVVSFDAQGGSAVASQTIGHGQAATVPAVPTRAGYAFAGWFTTPTGGAEWADSAPVTAALTVYAGWDALVPTTVSVSIEDDLVAIPAGRSVTIFGTVTPTTAVGTIELFEDGVSIGSGAVVGGGYQINTFALAGGNYVYTAVFTPGEPRFVSSTSAPVDLVVNPLRPRFPAPATDTDGLLDEIDANGWPVHPLPGGLDSVLGKNVPWTNPLDSFADVYVYSTAQWLGTYAVVGGKVDSGYWAFMPTLTPGPHHLVFVGQTSRTVSVYEFSVPAPAVAALPPVTPVALASTGIEPAPWASLGLVLLLLGAGLVARRRVRSA